MLILNTGASEGFGAYAFSFFSCYDDDGSAGISHDPGDFDSDSNDCNVAASFAGTGAIFAIAVYVGIGTCAGPSVVAGGQLRPNFTAW